MRRRRLQIALAASAVGPAVLAVGFVAQADWAVATWPYETGPLSNLFLGAILAAIAVATLWVAASADWVALGSSAVFPLLMLAGLATFVLVDGGAGDDPGALAFAGVLAVGSLYSLVLVLVGARGEPKDRRPLPRLVRGSFGLFALVLAAAGAALVLGAQSLIPWPAGAESLVMFGIIFLAAASSYAYGALRPVWTYAYAALTGFLAYDLVLLPALLGHLADVPSEQRTSLVVYIAVLLYSAAVGAWFLLVRRDTRLWRRHAGS